MKKQYTFLVLGLCAGLFTTACSDDDYTNDFTRPAGGNQIFFNCQSQLDENNKVIWAAEQLRTYANILDTPLTVIYSSEEMNAAIERVKDYDLVLVDTAGFSYKNEDQRKDMRNLIESLDDKYEKDVYLVLSATTKYRDLMEIVDKYHEISDYKIIFTKLDETSSYGSLLNIRMYSGADVSYVTTGQNVPDDIEIFQSQKIVKQLLGGR